MSDIVYTTDIGNGDTLLYTENAIILNAYLESTSDYDIFEGTLMAMATATATDIEEIEINDNSKSHVQDMIELANLGKMYTEKDIIDFLLTHK